MTETLLERFVDPAPKVRLAALLEAGRLDTLDGKDAIVEGIVRRLKDEHPGIRQAAIDMLGKLTTSLGLEVKASVVEWVIELTSDETEGVRSEAVSALAVLGEELDVPGRQEAVRTCLRDQSERVRASAMAAAGDLRLHDAADVIAEGLEHKDTDLRFEAAFALATLKDSRSLPVLTAALAKPKLRLDACEALHRLGNQEAVAPLRALLNKWLLAWVDKLAVQATLFTLGEPEAGDYVVARCASRNLRERTYAVALIGSHKIKAGRATLESIAHKPKDILQEAAVRALGELGDHDALPALEALRSESGIDEELREELDRALSLLKG